MTRYTNADFADDDSVNSVQLTEGNTSKLTQTIVNTHFFQGSVQVQLISGTMPATASGNCDHP